MRELVSRWGNVVNTVLLLSRTMGSGHLAQLDLLSRAQSWWRRAQYGRVRGAGLELWNAAQSLNTISHRINRSNRFIASTGTTISLSYYQLCFNTTTMFRLLVPDFDKDTVFSFTYYETHRQYLVCYHQLAFNITTICRFFQYNDRIPDCSLNLFPASHVKRIYCFCSSTPLLFHVKSQQMLKWYFLELIFCVIWVLNKNTTRETYLS